MPEVAFQAGSFCWVEVSTKDQAGAKRFYSSLFGWDLEDFPVDDNTTYTIARIEGKDVGAISPAQDPSMPSTWNTYIGVTSADETAEKVQSAGGTVVMGPFDVMDQGRMFVAQDPAGAFFSAWEPKATSGWGLAWEDNTVVWVELVARGKDKAVGFYQEVFGWSVGENPYESADDDADFDYTVLMNGADYVGGAMEMTEQWPPDVPSHWMVYIGVADCDASTAQARELGGQVIVEPVDTPAGRMAQIADPTGAVFSIIKMSPPPGT